MAKVKVFKLEGGGWQVSVHQTHYGENPTRMGAAKDAAQAKEYAATLIAEVRAPRDELKGRAG